MFSLINYAFIIFTIGMYDPKYYSKFLAWIQTKLKRNTICSYIVRLKYMIDIHICMYVYAQVINLYIIEEITINFIIN